MASYSEMVRAAAETIVTDAGGTVPDGATHNEVVMLAAATIVTGGIFTAIDGYDAEKAQTLEHDNTGAMLWVDKV
jgi:hypothetical protein